MKLINEIAAVSCKFHDGVHFTEPAFDFLTKEEVYIEEGDYETNEFRIEKAEVGFEIYALISDGYYISDEATHKFDGAAIYDLCLNEEDVEDLSDDYVEWYAGEVEKGEIERPEVNEVNRIIINITLS